MKCTISKCFLQTLTIAKISWFINLWGRSFFQTSLCKKLSYTQGLPNLSSACLSWLTSSPYPAPTTTAFLHACHTTPHPPQHSCPPSPPPLPLSLSLLHAGNYLDRVSERLLITPWLGSLCSVVYPDQSATVIGGAEDFVTPCAETPLLGLWQGNILRRDCVEPGNSICITHGKWACSLNKWAPCRKFSLVL